MKSLKRILVLLPAVTAMGLAACGPTSSSDSKTSEPTSTPTSTPTSEPTSAPTSEPTDETYKKVIMPAGAPAIAYYDRLLDKDISINTEPTNVMKQLIQGKEYGSVIFDFSKGLEKIAATKSDYRLARIITGGNLYLTGIGDENTQLPTKDDYIVSFGQGLLPDKVFATIYGEEIANVTHYVSSVSDAKGILEEGVHNGNPVDYVLIAEPALFGATHNPNAKTKGKVHVVDNLRTKWETITGQKAIPQAGLFVREKDYVNHTDYFNAQFEALDTKIDTAISNPAAVKAKMDEQIPDVKEQAKLLKFNSAMVMGVQGNNNNGFALVGSEDAKTIDITSFLSTLGVQTDYSDYILKTGRFF